MDWLNTAYSDDYGRYIDLAIEHGMNLIGALAILIAGLWASGMAERMALKAMGKTEKMDQTVSMFLSAMLKYVVVAFTILAVLDRFGVQTTSLVALLGAAGLAIGLALQGTLSNLAAGVMLLIFRPFKVGDFVDVGGNSGSVVLISLFTTHLNTPDNVRLIVPNGNIWGGTISNFSGNDTRRADIVMSIDYDDDIDKAFAVMKSVVDADTRVLTDPEPVYFVVSLAASSIDVAVRIWSPRADLFTLKSDLLRAMKEAFDKEGLSIPYPHQVLVQRGD